MYSDLIKLCIGHDKSILDAVTLMDSSTLGIVLVVDDGRRLVGTITDGDVRRALLAKIDFNQSVHVLLARKAGSRYARPITARVAADRSAYLNTLKQHNILHLPILDAKDRVVGLVRFDEFMPEHLVPLQAVIVAGGSGMRLRPLTEHTPKPMLPVGDRPLMEIIIEQLREAGITRVNVTTHHNQDKIAEHFGDGHEFGVELTYVSEDRPLGTAGALGLMGTPLNTVLVINGDILTGVDFRAMLAYHREHAADLTMAVWRYDLQVPYGVVECDGTSVRRLTEKPVLDFLVNGGIYLLEPSVYGFIQNGERVDMTDLIQRLLDTGRPVASFPIREYWVDIGEPSDYERAKKDAGSWKLRA